MKSKLSEESQSLLVLIKLDARRLYERVRYRSVEYLTVFSIKRTREHFKEVFKSKFDSVKIDSLIQIDQEILVALDQFYSQVDELKWYLGCTEDMPTMVEDKVQNFIREISPLYETLNLYINAELGLKEEPQEQTEKIDEFFEEDRQEEVSVEVVTQRVLESNLETGS